MITENDEKAIFAGCSNLPRGEKVKLKRHMGESYFNQNMSTRLAVIACIPTSSASQLTDTEWENVFFTLCTMCWNPEGAPMRAEYQVADAILGQAAPEAKFGEIISMRAEPRGRLYRDLGRYIQQAGKRINVNALLNDLQTWNDRDTKTKENWATAYTNLAHKQSANK